MRRVSILALLALCIAFSCGFASLLDPVGVGGHGTKASPALTSLIESERAFAKASGEKGTRDAFLEFLADESLLFTPGPSPGKLFYRNRPSIPTRLSWAPELADVSAAGDLGYTSGPWELRKTAADPPTGFGHFNSIWRVQKDSQWRLEVDLGISHEKPAVALADVKTVDSPKDIAPAPKETKPALDWQNELLDADRALAKRADAEGVVKAFDTAAADSVRVFRNEHLPAIGKADALKLLTASGTGLWQPTLARVAKSGDLGYSSGAIRMTPPEVSQPGKSAAPGASASGGATAPNVSSTGATPPAPATPHFYVRIWRRDKAGVWKVVLDVTT